MAKTISKRKSSSSRARAARLSRAVAATGGRAVVADELDELPDDENEDAEDAVETDDDAPQALASDVDDDIEDDDEPDDLALTDEELERANRRAVAIRTHQAPAPTYQRGGIYVPEFLLANPITRWPTEAYIELRKAVWPTFTEARNMTIIVIVISALVALILGLADIGLTKLVAWLTGLIV